MTRFVLPLVLVLITVACSQEDEAVITDDIDLVVRCGTLIDGLSDEVVRDQLVVIRQERFYVHTGNR